MGRLNAYFQRRRRTLAAGLGVWSLAGAMALTPSCHQGIDTEREAMPKATLGDDMYGVMCDRLGASVIHEDLTGASYHAVCHYDAKGVYGDRVDVSVLPPVTGERAVTARTLSLAKMHMMVKWRSKLVRAFNAAFPNIDIPDPTTPAPTDTVRLHDALLKFSQDITALYEENPFDPNGGPIMPQATDGLGVLFAALESSDEARAALTRIAGRKGYRPFQHALGAIRTLLAYPEMRPMVQSNMEVIGPGGPGVPQLQQLLKVAKRELSSTRPTLVGEQLYSVAPATAQPNRTRSALEVIAALALDQHDGYAAGPNDASRYIALRDRRGFAIPFGSQPGVQGSVGSPFVDQNNDGYADVDGQGRFVGADLNPLSLDTPFAVPDRTDLAPRDPFERALNASGTTPVYASLDTTRTLLGALMRDMVPMMDPNRYGDPNDPEPWREDHETAMYAMAGMHLLAGPREQALYDHYSEQVMALGTQCPVATPPAKDPSLCRDGAEGCACAGSSCDGGLSCMSGVCAVPCTEFSRFVTEQSPIPDLLHAAGQFLAHPDSDVIILALLELIENHENVVALMMDAALDIKAIADAHDEAAAQGTEPKAELPYATPVWDEIGDVVNDMAQRPGLIAKLLNAMADPVIVGSHTQDPKITGAPSQHYGETIAAFMENRDRYEYDRQDINGPAFNATDGYPSFANPHNPVDRTRPLNGDNRSMWERSAQMIYDGNRAKACNKDGAQVYTNLVFELYFPPGGSYTECELMTFENMAGFYLDAQLPSTHPKRSELVIKPGELQTLLSLIGLFISQDSLLEQSSGIDGLTLHPSPEALNRLMFFGANSDKFGMMPDYDSQNAGTDTSKFVESALDTVGAVVCPPNANAVNTCASQDDVLRMRQRGTIFAWERLGFFQYLRPQLRVFSEVGCNASVTQCDTADYTGENYFVDLITALWKHWPNMDHGSYCSHTVSKTDPRYCSGAGISHYEPILTEAFRDTNIVLAMHEFAKVAVATNITIDRGPNAGQTINGADVVELLVKILFDQAYAQSAGMTDRAGNKGTTWVDGTPQAQVTGYSLFADALHKMDATFDTSSDPTAAERKAKWKRARSQMVDQFLLVDVAGGSATFKNRAATRTLATVLRVLREQLNANCPDRETSGQCLWAKNELGNKLGDAMGRPLFAALGDVTDQLNGHDGARREVERFMSYALDAANSPDALQGMLASVSDLLQLLQADGDFAPLFNAVSVGANPSAEGPGCVDRAIGVLKSMADDRYDRYHVLDYVLPAVVTPMDGTGSSPIEVILDAIADVHRTDAALGLPEGEAPPLTSGDYQFVMKTVKEFFIGEFRGFPQLYYIVSHRQRPEEE